MPILGSVKILLSLILFLVGHLSCLSASDSEATNSLRPTRFNNNYKKLWPSRVAKQLGDGFLSSSRFVVL